MADEKSTPESPKRAASSRHRVDAPATRAEARARVLSAAGMIGPDLASAAARAVAELRVGFAHRSAQIGFLDDVVDFAHDVVDVTEEVINHIAANTEEITNELEHVTPEITPATIILTTGIANEPGGGGPVPGTEEPRGASAEELLKARQVILDATAIQSNGLKAMAQSLRAQIAAMRRPKP